MDNTRADVAPAKAAAPPKKVRALHEPSAAHESSNFYYWIQEEKEKTESNYSDDWGATDDLFGAEDVTKPKNKAAPATAVTKVVSETVTEVVTE